MSVRIPIVNGLLQSDLDCAGFDLLNFPGGGLGASGITPLVNGQSYIAVTFDTPETDPNWVMTGCVVANTLDATPLNISPGTLTTKTTAGFIIQLDGVPDSSNYSLHWSLLSSGPVATGYAIVDTTVSGQNVRIIKPAVRVAHTAVVYCHGLGETASVGFDPATADKTLYMLGALEAGYLLASGTYHGDQWDNATAQADIEALVAYLVSNYAVTDLVLWSQSAGGPLGLLKATQGFSGVTVRGWFGIYPIVDLNTAHANSLMTASINAAFPSYPTDAAGRDPILLPAANYNGLRLRCCQSPTDQYVPSASHGNALVTLTTGHATETACIATTGLHGDPSNFTQARADDFLAFINRCF